MAKGPGRHTTIGNTIEGQLSNSLLSFTAMTDMNLMML
jgi:hypothetical protein